MSIYYDTGAPTPASKNSITRTATDFRLRDFLLHKNIQNPIKYPFLSTSINGSPKGGEPFLDTMQGTGVVISHVSVEVDGIFRYNNAILMNHYKNTDSTAPSLIDIENIPTSPIFPTSPSGVSNYPDEDITKYGLLAKNDFKQFRKLATIKNLYVDAAKQIDMADFVSLQPQITGQQLPSYLDEYGGLNLGGSGAIQAADIIGSVLNGQGLGLAKGGIVTNYDIRASLAGRVLTATGLINDTKLGVIGGQQLALALANNAAFNTEQYIFGKLNVADNILDLVRNGNIEGLRPDYKITTPSTTGGQIANVAEKVLGFTVPKSYLSDAGSIFLTESGIVSNIDRANEMLNNTGKGQRKALASQFFANLNGISPNLIDNPDKSPFRSGYSPRYQKGTGVDTDFIVAGKKPKLYAFDDAKDSGFVRNFLQGATNEDAIDDMNWNREKLVADSGFIGVDGNDNTYSVNDGRAFATKFAWTTSNDAAINSTVTLDTFEPNSKFDEFVGEKKSLLTKTQKLFNSFGMKNIISVKGDSKVTTKTQIQGGISANGFLSRGSGIISGSKFNPDGTFNFGTNDNAENTFCRAWTPFNRYDTVDKLIRYRGLNQTSSGGQIIKNGNHRAGWRQNTNGSVLDNNGFVKIAPYKTDDISRGATTPKKYMFSLENLAWAGTPAANLLKCEQGPGDLLSGTFGRIMWFPPYDLNFSESSNVNLESTNFIGRGEPLYTYNNTERTGQLSFKLVVDHPSILNAFAGDNRVENEYIDSFFAGCVDINEYWQDKLTGLEKNEVENKQVVNVVKETKAAPALPTDFKIYFKNDRVDVDPAYEANPSGEAGIAPYQSIDLDYKKQPNGKCIKQKNKHTWTDDKSYGLNLNSKVKIGNIFDNSWIDSNFGSKLKEYFNTPEFKDYKVIITVNGFASKQGCLEQNKLLAMNRANNVRAWLAELLQGTINSVTVKAAGQGESGPAFGDSVEQWEKTPKENRFATIHFDFDIAKTETKPTPQVQDNSQAKKTFNTRIKRRFYTECDFFEKMTDSDPFVFDKIRQKIRYFHPAFHSTTPEGFNSRLTFLLQCTRQGATISDAEPKNLAFGPAPVCILRVGDFYNTKIMIDNVSFDFEPLVWDLNPEGVGVQPMIANVTISFKYLGGSSLYGPISKLQNALSFNYFANTHVYDARADYISGSTSDYGLVTGIDMSKERVIVGELQKVSEKDFYKNGTDDQVKASDEATNSSSSPTSSSDINRLKLSDVTSSVINFGQYSGVSFKISRKNSSDNKSLLKSYNVTVNITNSGNASEKFSINLAEQLGAGDINKVFNFSLETMSPVCNGLNLTASTYNFDVKIGDAGTLQYVIPKVGDSISGSTVVQKISQQVITYSNTVNFNSGNFLDDIHGAASSSKITNDFSEQVGSILNTSNGAAVKDISMQTIYDKSTKNATTKLNCLIYPTANGFSYKHFDARGSIGTLANQANTLARFQAQHTHMMDIFKDKSIMKIGNTVKNQITIEGVDYLYYEAFYQWTD